MPEMCGTVIVPSAVVDELEVGRRAGIDLPDVSKAAWATIKAPPLPRS